jgi:hypothetical protein
LSGIKPQPTEQKIVAVITEMSLPRYKQIGRMKALVEMMERGQFKYPVTFKDHNEREVYRSVATALYLEKVYKNKC